jgi:outer membrane murein-binding lipoprotein Lpp
MATKIQIRRDTAARWTSNNPILSSGELGYDTNNRIFKIGNGIDTWNELTDSFKMSSNFAPLVNGIVPEINLPDYSDVYAPINEQGIVPAENLPDYSDVYAPINEQGIVPAENLPDYSDVYAPIVNGKVPAENLPSYVDDVLEYANLAALPNPGESGKIYITLDTNKVYRYGISTYIEISSMEEVTFQDVTGLSFNQSENGKLLGVVNGQLTWVEPVDTFSDSTAATLTVEKISEWDSVYNVNDKLHELVGTIVESYRIKTGETIDVGDFVDFVIQEGQISLGNNTTFSNQNISSVYSAKLDNNKVLIIYNSSAIIGTVSGSSISWGTATPFNSGGSGSVSIAVLNSNKIVVTYNDQGNSNYGTSIVGTVSGSSITFGDEVTVNSANTFNISTAVLNSDKIVVVYSNGGNSNRGTYRIGTVTDSAIVFTSPLLFNNVDNTFYPFVVKLNDSKILVSYAVGLSGLVRIGTVNILDNTIVWSDELTSYTSETSYENTVFVLNDNKIAIIFLDGNYHGASIIGEISQDFSAITWGSKNVFVTSDTGSFNLAKLTNERVALFYTSQSGVFSRIGIITGVNVAWGDPTSINNSFFAPASAVGLTNEKIVVSFGDGTFPNFLGKSRVFDLLEFEKFLLLATDNIFGVAKTSGSGGQRIEVYVETLSDTLSTQTNIIDALGDSLTTLSGTVSTLSSDIDTISSDVSTINSTVSTLDSDLDTINSTVSTLDSNIQSSNKISTLLGVVLESYRVAALSTVDASDFVKYVLGPFTTTDPISFANAYANSITAVNLSDNRVLVAYDHEGEAEADSGIRVLTISDNTINIGPRFALPNDVSFAGNMQTVLVSENKVLFLYRDNDLNTRASILTISGNTITGAGIPLVLGTDFSTSNRSVSYVSNNKALIVSYKSERLNTSVLTISGTTISSSSPTILVNEDTSFFTTSQLSDNKVLFVYSNPTNSFRGVAIILEISGTQIVASTPLTFETAANNVSYAAAKLSDDKVILTYKSGFAVPFKARIISTLSPGSNDLVAGSAMTTAIAQADDFSNKITVVSPTNAVLLYTESGVNNYFKQALDIATDSTITNSGNRSTIDYVLRIDAVKLSEGRSLIVYSEIFAEGSSTPIANAIIFGGEETVAPAVGNDPVFGVAKTGGIAGSMVDVYVDGINPKIDSILSSTSSIINDIVNLDQEVNELENTLFGTVDELAFTIDANLTSSYAPLASPVFTGVVTLPGILEKSNIVSGAANSTPNIDLDTSAVWYFTSNSTGNWTMNIRASSTTALNDRMAIGQSVSVAVAVTNGATPYIPTPANIQIDLNTGNRTIRWQGGTVPTAGNANSIDVYTFTIIKTANNTFTVLAAQTRFG